jgi:hypothetical protein
MRKFLFILLTLSMGMVCSEKIFLCLLIFLYVLQNGNIQPYK